MRTKLPSVYVTTNDDRLCAIQQSASGCRHDSGDGGAGPAVGTLMRQILDHIMWVITTPICLRKIQRLPQRRTLIMTDNPNKKTFWDKVHLDPQCC